jgi:hypothetical protein
MAKRERHRLVLPRRSFRRKFKLYQAALCLAGALVFLNRLLLLRSFDGSKQVDSRSEIAVWESSVSSPDKSLHHLLNETDCFSDACIESRASVLARQWHPRHHTDWCSEKAAAANTTGLWLVKVPKSASSTVAGLVLRIAELHQCPVRWQHGKAVELMPHLSDAGQTFLLAPIRHPWSRTLSSVYYHSVSLQQRALKGGRPSDAFIIRQLELVEDDYVSDYTRVSVASTEPEQIVREILQQYSFLLVVEQMEASLVVLAWLTNLPLSDVVIMTAKSSGSWYAAGGRRCVSLVKPEKTPAIDSYWKTTGKRRHHTDRLLHAAARLSLHRTILEGMGARHFQEQLQKLRALQTFVIDECGEVMNGSAPCSPNGVHQPEISRDACYLRDFGCGHRCVDQAAEKYKAIHSM